MGFQGSKVHQRLVQVKECPHGFLIKEILSGKNCRCPDGPPNAGIKPRLRHAPVNLPPESADHCDVVRRGGHLSWPVDIRSARDIGLVGASRCLRVFFFSLAISQTQAYDT